MGLRAGDDRSLIRQTRTRRMVMSNVSRRDFLKAAAGTAAGVVGAGLALPALARAAGQLSNQEIIRAWKDEAFRNSLTEEQLAQLPKHPAGQIEFEDRNPYRTTILSYRRCTRGR